MWNWFSGETTLEFKQENWKKEAASLYKRLQDK